MYPKRFEDLIHAFQLLPGVSEKTAQRYAYTVLDIANQADENLVNALNGIDGVLKVRIIK